jgi:nucleoside-diphosphate-sugar epimerase
MENNKQRLNILVTGGAGFLGKAIVEELLSDSSPVRPTHIVVYDICAGPEKGDSRVTNIRGDIRDLEFLTAVCKDIDIVIHSAAIIDWGTHPEDEVMAINVTGTENVIKACRKNRIKMLIFTSSLDAVYNGKPLINIDEEHPYPTEHPNSYCRSKYLAEKLVLEANGPELKTSVLRPSDIYGPGDPYHIDSLINMAKSGFYVRLGDGISKCQHVYVRNMAMAHVLMAKALLDGNEKVEGNVYFITDSSGNFFKFFDQVVERAGYKIWPKNFWIPRSIAYAMGSITEGIALLLRPIKKYNPGFSRFAVIYTCTNFTFSSKKAQRDFNYTPRYSEEEALSATADYYRKN